MYQFLETGQSQNPEAIGVRVPRHVEHAKSEVHVLHDIWQVMHRSVKLSYLEIISLQLILRKYQNYQELVGQTHEEPVYTNEVAQVVHRVEGS